MSNSGGRDDTPEAAGPEAPPLESVLQGIHEWAARRRKADPDASVVKGRVANEIASYLGEDGTRRVLEPLEGGENLIPTVESVLSIFLGSKTAAKLTRHVVDAAIERI